MAISTSSGNIFTQGQSIDGFTNIFESPSHPFKVFHRTQASDGKLLVSVSPHSAIIKDFNTTETFPISGIGNEFPLSYGEKIYLEIIYGKTGLPIVAQIKHGKTWDSKTIIAASKKEETTYPKSIELITKSDIESKTTELRNNLQKLQQTFNDQSSLIQKYKANGILRDEVAMGFVKKLEKDYNIQKESLTTFINNFGKLFSASDTKKQLKSFTLIAYTTQDLSSTIDGDIVTSASSTGQVNVPFKIVQCLKNDLALVDTCYQHTPCTIPFISSSPVYYFEPNYNGTSEESINTKNV